MKPIVARLTRSPLFHRVDVEASTDARIVALCGREDVHEHWFVAPEGSEADCSRCVVNARRRAERIVERHRSEGGRYVCAFGHDVDRDSGWCREGSKSIDCPARGFRCTCCGEVTYVEDVRDELCPACAGLCVACGEHQGTEETGYGEPICSGCADRDWLSARAGTEPARFAALRQAAPEVFAEEEDIAW